MLLDLLESRAMNRGGWQDRHTEALRERIDIDLHTPLLRLVHHVQADGDLLSHVDELHRQKEIALQMNGIDNIEDDISLENDIPRNALLVVERADSIDAGSIVHSPVRMLPMRNLDGSAREVGDIDIESRQKIEEDRLADIGVADQNQLLLCPIEERGCGGDRRLSRVRERYRELVVIEICVVHLWKTGKCELTGVGG